MQQGFDNRLAAVTSADSGSLRGGLRGVEKEALRVTQDGVLAMTTHPEGLGSALTNRYITTDFSEALLEFVTPAYASTWEALQCICDIHQFTYSQLGDEMLWPASMPCLLPDEEEIPLARYGSSNVGRMKTIYRRGLGFRYGRQMQVIAGVHFNYSLPRDFWPVFRDCSAAKTDLKEFRSTQYLHLIRNFRRMGWLVLYLFGASPVVCKSFSAAAGLQSLNADTYFEPFATSLRMSDLGYNNQNQSRINISLNSLDDYVHDLSSAIRTPEPAYEAIGVRNDGQYRQLNANLLQIENEFYSPVRPKRVARSGEQPTAALRRDGIEYVEIRSLDINPFDPSGINQNTMRFIEAFLVYCLLEDSPHFDADALKEVTDNHAGTAKHGRDPEFRLARDGVEVALSQWATEILEKVRAVAESIDDGGGSYVEAVRLMQQLVDDPSATPSARVISDLGETQSSFFEYVLELARTYSRYFATITPLDDARRAEFEAEASDSIRRQREIEAADAISLDEYLQQYLSNY